MENLKKINQSVKAKQSFRFIGGMISAWVGLSLLFDYFEAKGYSNCQKFISRYYPEEYSAITKDIIEGLNNH